MRKLITGLLFFFIITGSVSPVLSQTAESPSTREGQFLNEAVDVLEAATEDELASDESTVASEETRTASLSAEQQQQIQQIKEEDVTKPEEPEVKDRILLLFERRPITDVSLLNFFGYAVQYAVGAGVPANTVVLILLLPILATMIAFVRHVVGLPSLGLTVPIALSITLVSTGVTAGVILTATIILSSTLARMILKHVKIMQLPKMALSMFVVALFVFITLTFSAKAGILVVRQLSIFPVLLLILLSERVVQLQLERSLRETVLITFVTFMLGVLGFFILSTREIRDVFLLYPELVLLLIPANILIGRYFGLRLTEYYRFAPIRNASK